MDNFRIAMAQRRLNRGHIHEKQELKITQAPIVTDVTPDVSEIVEQEPDTRTLKEIWEQECDAGITYKIFKQRLGYGWSLERALHERKAR